MQRFWVCSSQYKLEFDRVKNYFLFDYFYEYVSFFIIILLQFAELEHAKAAQSLNAKLEIAGRVIKVNLCF